MACELHPGAATSWSVPIPTTLAIAAAVLLYLRGWRLLRRSSPEVATGHRSWTFVGGMLVLWVVVGSPLSALDHALLTFHMVQHLLLMTVAAPLILLGTPGVAFVRGVPGLIRRAAGMFLRSAAVRRIGRSLTHPVSCWVHGPPEKKPNGEETRLLDPVPPVPAHAELVRRRNVPRHDHRRTGVHPARHLREPVIEGGKNGEEDAADDHVMKMRDDEVRRPQLPVEECRAQPFAGVPATVWQLMQAVRSKILRPSDDKSSVRAAAACSWIQRSKSSRDST